MMHKLSTLAFALAFLPDALAAPHAVAPTPSVIPAKIGVFQYIGCWSDLGSCHTLKTKLEPCDNTNEACAAQCAGYAYFGTENSSDCYCGNSLAAGSTLTTDGRCNMACSGDSTEICGGSNGLTLYGNPALVPGLKPTTTSSSSTKSTTSSSSTSSTKSTTSSSTTSTTSSSSTSSTKSTTSSSTTSTTSSSSTSSTKSSTSSSTSSSTTSSSTTSSTKPPASATCVGKPGYGVYDYVVANGQSQVTNVNECGAACVANSACKSFAFSTQSLVCFLYNVPVATSLVTADANSQAFFFDAACTTYNIPPPPSSSTTSSTTSSSTTSSATPTPTLVNGLYAYQNCVEDGYSARGLNGPAFQSATLTLESCATFCSGYTYFGVENTVECYCGNALQLTSPPASGCNAACPGNNKEICGGFSRMSVYGIPSAIAAAKPVNGYAYQGCYVDGYSARGLTGPQLRGATVNLETCSTFCAGFTYFGVENVDECYCGNVLEPSSAPATSGCNTPCAGNSAEICGGFSRMSLYGVPAQIAAPLPDVNNYKYQGCYTDGYSSRGLTGPSFQGATVTLESCAAFCTGYTYWGVENNAECYCGNTIQQSSIMVPTSNGCNAACAGNNKEICGGFSRMSVYAYPPWVLNPGNPGPL